MAIALQRQAVGNLHPPPFKGDGDDPIESERQENESTDSSGNRRPRKRRKRTRGRKNVSDDSALGSGITDLLLSFSKEATARASVIGRKMDAELLQAEAEKLRASTEISKVQLEVKRLEAETARFNSEVRDREESRKFQFDQMKMMMEMQTAIMTRFSPEKK
jgi:hypothetical protein